MRIELQIECSVAAEADAGEMWVVQRAAFLDEAFDLDNITIPPLNETLGQVRQAMTETTMVKAVAGTRIVGAGRLRQRNGVGWIERVAVAPDMQGHGVGSRLLAAIEQQIDADATRWELYTVAARSGNVAFYRRHGYSEIERLVDRGIELVHYGKSR